MCYGIDPLSRALLIEKYKQVSRYRTFTSCWAKYLPAHISMMLGVLYPQVRVGTEQIVVELRYM